ncbi:MAG: hypothetical protein ACHP7P_14685 [Terriglobales bacterium]
MARGKPPKGAISPMQFFSKLRWLDDRPLLDVIEPYRVAIFNSVLWDFDADGRPKINMALTGRAKKEWKTTDLVLAGLYRFTVWPSQWGNSSAIIASDLDQAGDDLSLCQKLIARNPILSNALEVRVKQIIRKDTGDKLDILPAQDADGLHGKTFCFLGKDEIHTQLNYKIFEALAQDPLRLDTLTWMASYAPIVARPGIPIVDFLAMGKRGEDSRFYLSWYGGDFSTDPDFQDPNLSPERRANPTWDADREAYLVQQKRRLPSAQYRRLHLNLSGSPEGAAFDADAVMAAIIPGRKRLPYDERFTYLGGVDLSGGSSDFACLAIVHMDENGRVVLDVLINQGAAPPFNPRDAIARFAMTLKEYNVYSVWGDAFAGNTFRADFEARGIAYHPILKPKHVLYSALEAPLLAGELEWIDEPVLVDEALGLVYRSGGKIDHVAGMHDDHVNAVAVATFVARAPEFSAPIIIPFVCDNQSHGSFDRRQPSWHDTIPMPLVGAVGDYEKNEEIGSLRWQNDLMRRRGEIQ